MNKKLLFIASVIVFLLILGVAFLSFNRKPPPPAPPSNAQTVPTLADSLDTFSHPGEGGKDALTILKEKTTVKLDNSGLVITINNKLADSEKHEFWAFYINGQMANIGPSDYQTKNTDNIEWKIETY